MFISSLCFHCSILIYSISSELQVRNHYITILLGYANVYFAVSQCFLRVYVSYWSCVSLVRLQMCWKVSVPPRPGRVEPLHTASYSSGSGFPMLGNSFRLRFPSQLSKKKSSKSRNASNRDGSAAGRHAVMQLSWVDRLYLAVGCCRGLAALHAYSADLCHRDIKSFNFLGSHILSVRYLLNAMF